jgi:hypothetical protein
LSNGPPAWRPGSCGSSAHRSALRVAGAGRRPRSGPVGSGPATPGRSHYSVIPCSSTRYYKVPSACRRGAVWTT